MCINASLGIKRRYCTIVAWISPRPGRTNFDKVMNIVKHDLTISAEMGMWRNSVRLNSNEHHFVTSVLYDQNHTNYFAGVSMRNQLEMFACGSPQNIVNYFNWEINCVKGTKGMAHFVPAGPHALRPLITPWVFLAVDARRQRWNRSGQGIAAWWFFREEADLRLEFGERCG